MTGLPDVVGLAIGLLVLAAGLGSFVFSLFGLHRQITEVKDRQLEVARRLYAEAYDPLREAPTLEALERQHTLLGAADALERRARAIHDWPVAEGTWAWVIGIADERRRHRLRPVDPAALRLLGEFGEKCLDRARNLRS